VAAFQATNSQDERNNKTDRLQSDIKLTPHLSADNLVMFGTRISREIAISKYDF